MCPLVTLFLFCFCHYILCVFFIFMGWWSFFLELLRVSRFKVSKLDVTILDENCVVYFLKIKSCTLLGFLYATKYVSTTSCKHYFSCLWSVVFIFIEQLYC